MTKHVFKDWQEEQLDELLKIAEESKRSYGCLNELKKQHKILKEKFKDLVSKKDSDEWLKICSYVELFTGLELSLSYAVL